MANIDIDTTSQAYQKLLDGVGTLRTLLTPRFKVFVKLPRAKQLLWLQQDPLLKAVLRLVRDVVKADVAFGEVD